VLEDAALFWESVLYGDVPELAINVGQNDQCLCDPNDPDPCKYPIPAVNETVDDVIIYAYADSVDGVFGTLAAAAPCWVRSNQDGTEFAAPLVGGMLFDTADLAANSLADRLATATHEMGHVLGLGTYWKARPSVDDPFLENPSCAGDTGPFGFDTHFSGPLAIQAFDAVGGTSYVAGEKVPVENAAACPGSSDGHWRESVLGTELMTYALNSGVVNPVSVVTLASLMDLDILYLITLSGAETFALPVSLPAAAAGSGVLRFVDDIPPGPVYGVSPNGVVRLAWQRQ
jgi:hypothetical protein